MSPGRRPWEKYGMQMDSRQWQPGPEHTHQTLQTAIMDTRTGFSNYVPTSFGVTGWDATLQITTPPHMRLGATPPPPHPSPTLRTLSPQASTSPDEDPEEQMVYLDLSCPQPNRPKPQTPPSTPRPTTPMVYLDLSEPSTPEHSDTEPEVPQSNSESEVESHRGLNYIKNSSTIEDLRAASRKTSASSGSEAGGTNRSSPDYQILRPTVNPAALSRICRRFSDISRTSTPSPPDMAAEVEIGTTGNPETGTQFNCYEKTCPPAVDTFSIMAAAEGNAPKTPYNSYLAANANAQQKQPTRISNIHYDPASGITSIIPAGNLQLENSLYPLPNLISGKSVPEVPYTNSQYHPGTYEQQTQNQRGFSVICMNKPQPQAISSRPRVSFSDISDAESPAPLQENPTLQKQTNRKDCTSTGGPMPLKAEEEKTYLDLSGPSTVEVLTQESYHSQAEALPKPQEPQVKNPELNSKAPQNFNSVSQTANVYENIHLDSTTTSKSQSTQPETVKYVSQYPEVLNNGNKRKRRIPMKARISKKKSKDSDSETGGKISRKSRGRPRKIVPQTTPRTSESDYEFPPGVVLSPRKEKTPKPYERQKRPYNKRKKAQELYEFDSGSEFNFPSQTALFKHSNKTQETKDGKPRERLILRLPLKPSLSAGPDEDLSSDSDASSRPKSPILKKKNKGGRPRKRPLTPDPSSQHNNEFNNIELQHRPRGRGGKRGRPLGSKARGRKSFLEPEVIATGFDNLKTTIETYSRRGGRGSNRRGRGGRPSCRMSCVSKRRYSNTEDQDGSLGWQLRPRRVPRDEVLIKKCKEILEALLDDDDSHAREFYILDDPDRLELKDFMEACPNILDIRSIWIKADKGMYSSCTEFSKDVSILVDNCNEYFDPEDNLYQLIQKFETAFAERFTKMFLLTDSSKSRSTTMESSSSVEIVEPEETSPPPPPAADTQISQISEVIEEDVPSPSNEVEVDVEHLERVMAPTPPPKKKRKMSTEEEHHENNSQENKENFMETETAKDISSTLSDSNIENIPPILDNYSSANKEENKVGRLNRKLRSKLWNEVCELQLYEPQRINDLVEIIRKHEHNLEIEDWDDFEIDLNALQNSTLCELKAVVDEGLRRNKPDSPDFS